MDKNREIITELKKHLQEHLGDLIRDVILFGSQAKGNSHADSDYDILIITREKFNWKMSDRISSLCWEFQDRYNIWLDTHILGVSELETIRGQQPVFQDAINYGLYA